jgi:hypothetical protein
LVADDVRIADRHTGPHAALFVTGGGIEFHWQL